MQVIKTCPFCGAESTLYVKDDQWENYMRGMNIRMAFDDIDEFGRELIISGMCFTCQEKTFNKPLKYHEEEWGKLLGDCVNCGCPIYENHNKGIESGEYICPSCRTKMHYEEGSELVEDEDEQEA